MVYRIATFGCWNNKRVLTNEKIAFEKVTELIRYNNETKQYNELVILGDNYYPNKIKKGDKKVVIYDEDEVEHGFCTINQIKIPNKYLIMGNHDLDDTLIYTTKDDTSTPIEDCRLLDYQMKLSSNGLNVAFPFKYEIREINGIKYKYIFIDTTIYGYNANQTTCTDKIFKKDYNFIKDKQNKFILAQIQPNVTNVVNDDANHIIIFGHEPLISVKKGSDDYKKNMISELLNLIYGINTDKKISYVCADVHLYQSCKITKQGSGMEINQIVCGTGGAELDSMPETATPPIILSNINATGYNIRIDDFRTTFGYVELELTNTGLNHIFIPIDEEQVGGGGVRRYWINY